MNQSFDFEQKGSLSRFSNSKYPTILTTLYRIDALEILRINHMRWQIEDCFRELKTEFKSRPVYLSRENRIKAHFLLCSLSLILLKYLEKSMTDYGFRDFTTEKLLDQLRDMELVHFKGFGYVPASNPSPILSALQDIFRIPVSKEIITEKGMKKITSVSLKQAQTLISCRFELVFL